MVWRRLKNSSGMSLIELIIAVGIMAGTLTALTSFFVNGIRLDEASRNLSMAVSHAQYVLEDIRSAAVVQIAAAGGTWDGADMVTEVDSGTWNWNEEAVESRGLQLLKDEQIATAASGSALVTVTVTVSWVDTQARARSVSLAAQLGGA